jgi:hypothetical protein
MNLTAALQIETVCLDEIKTTLMAVRHHSRAEHSLLRSQSKRLAQVQKVTRGSLAAMTRGR